MKIPMTIPPLPPMPPLDLGLPAYDAIGILPYRELQKMKAWAAAINRAQIPFDDLFKNLKKIPSVNSSISLLKGNSLQRAFISLNVAQFRAIFVWIGQTLSNILNRPLSDEGLKELENRIISLNFLFLELKKSLRGKELDRDFRLNEKSYQHVEKWMTLLDRLN